MALVSDIQLQTSAVKPPNLDTGQKFSAEGLTATTALAVTDAGAGTEVTALGLFTAHSGNDVNAWFKTTNADGDASIYLTNDARPDWALMVSGTASDSFIIANSLGTNSTAQYPALSIGTAGAVGIGKTGASNVLDITIANSTTGGIVLTDSTNSTATKILSDSTGGNIGTSSNSKLNFKTNDAIVATLDTDGLLGIGTTTPGNYYAGTKLALNNDSDCSTFISINADPDCQSGIYFADGTAGAAAYVGQIDYNHGNNRMTFVTNATAAMYIDNAGCVGIGTSTPGTNFQVQGTSCFVGAVTLGSAINVGADGAGVDVKFFGATSGCYLLWDASGDDLIISGDIGVGTTVAGIGGIDVAGKIKTKTTGGSAGSPAVQVQYAGEGEATGLWAPSAGHLGISAFDIQVVQINCKGQVGIGTTVVGCHGTLGRLEAVGCVLTCFGNIVSIDSGAIATAAVGGGIVFGGLYCTSGALYTTWGSIAGIRENTTEGNYDAAMIFRTRNTSTGWLEHMKITSAGQIGIGTTAPSAKMDIACSGADNVVKISSWSATDSHGPLISFQKSGSATIGTYVETADGECFGGIHWAGVNSSSASAGAGRIQFEQDGSAGATYIPGRIMFQTATAAAAVTSKMVLTSPGCLGIGTTAPASLLHVQGTGCFTDDVSIATCLNVGSAGYGVADLQISHASSADLVQYVSGGATNEKYYRQEMSGSKFQQSFVNDAWSASDVFFTAEQTASNVDCLMFKTDGACTRFIIDGPLLGIGTTAPNVNLHLYSGTTLEPHVKIENVNTNAYGSCFEFYKNTSAGNIADYDGIGQIDFYGNNDNGTPVKCLYSRVQSWILDFTDTTEDGVLELGVLQSGALRSAIRMLGNGPSFGPETVINEGGVDRDLRVETTAGAYGLVVEGSSGCIGIGTGAPEGTLHVVTSTVSVTPDTDADDLIVENNGRSGISILSSDASSGKLIFGSASDAVGASIAWNHDSDLMTLGTNNAGASLAFYSANGAEAVRIDSSGNVGIGTAYAADLLQVEGNVTVSNGYGLIIGDVTQQSPLGGVPELQILGTGAPDSSMGMGRYSADASGPVLFMWKSRAAAIGTDTIVQDGDELGKIQFIGADGTDITNHSVTILAEVDGTPGSNDTPGALVFQTAADGNSYSSERMRITQAGYIGIGTAAPGVLFDVNCSGGAPSSTAANTFAIFNNSAAAGCVSRVSIVGGATGYSVLDFGDTTASNASSITYNHTACDITFDAGGGNALSLLYGGSVVRGTSCPICVEGGMNAGIQNHATASTNSGIMNVRWQNSTAGSDFYLAKSRSATIGTQTIVTSGDDIGSVLFVADDGTDFVSVAASILGKVEGTVAADKTPGVLTFGTTSADANSTTERMRINSEGCVGIGTATIDATLHVHTASAGSITPDTDADDLVVENSGRAGISILSPDASSGKLIFGSASDAVGAQIAWNHNSDLMTIGTSNSGASLAFNSDNNAEAIRIDSSGNVGIGTTAPESNQVVTMTGDSLGLVQSTYLGNVSIFDDSALAASIGGGIMFGGKYTDEGAYTSWSGISGIRENATCGNYDAALVFNTRTTSGGWSENMRIASSGYVGIGTAAPEGIFQTYSSAASVWRNFTSAECDADMLFGVDVDGTAKYARIGIDFSNAKALSINASGSLADNHLVVTQDGCVGIGIDVPDSTLHVFTASAGSITPDTDADDLVVENNGRSGISILSPDASSGKLIFGTPSDAVGAHIAWNHDSDLMTVGTSNSGASLAFYSDNNAEAVRIDSSSNVGIGTAAPDFIASSNFPNVLTVFGSTSGNDRASLEIASRRGGAASEVGRLSFWNSEAAGNRLLATIAALTADSGESYSTQSGDLAFYTTTTASDGGGVSTERMRLDSEGAVGIGVVPVKWHTSFTALQLGGNGALMADTSAGAGLQFDLLQNATFDTDGSYEYVSTDEASRYSQYNGSHNFFVAASGTAGNDITWTTGMHINCNGNVGIGTTVPDGKLHLWTATAGSVTAHANGDNLILEDSGNVGLTFLSPDSSAQFIYFGDASEHKRGHIEYNHCDDYISMGTANNANLRIDCAGNVGIGTTTACSQLHITGSFMAYAGGNDETHRVTLLETTSGSDNGGFFEYDGTNNVGIIGTISGDADIDAIAVARDTGYVGIGTLAPAVLLHAQGSLCVTGDSTLSGTLIVANAMGTTVDDPIVTIRNTTSDAVGAESLLNFQSQNRSRASIAAVFTNAGNATSRLDFRVNCGTGTNVTNMCVMSLLTGGNVGIGTTAPGNQLEIAKSADEAIMELSSWSTTYTHQPIIIFQKSASATIGTMVETLSGEILGSQHYHGVNTSSATASAARIQIEQDGAAGATYIPGRIQFKTATAAAGVTERMRIDNGGCVGIGTDNPGQLLQVQGNMCLTGTLYKGAVSFSIDHPLESKKDTHSLVHTGIEAPQADLIYSGIVQLLNGTVQINIDTEAGMTDGTFVALNRCVRAFTSNETNWDAVRGSITGNVLTIDSNVSTSAACVSWMVIGERQDPYMMSSTDWTDNDGRVVVEPLKS